MYVKRGVGKWSWMTVEGKKYKGGVLDSSKGCTAHHYHHHHHRHHQHHHHHHHHQFLNREGRWGTTNDFATSFLHFYLFSTALWTCRTPGLSIPWCCIPTSSYVCLVFFPLSLCVARWIWPDLINWKHDHTTAVCVSLRSSGDLHVVKLPAGSWHGLPRW